MARRILFPYTGDTVGGSHVSSLILAKELQARGYDIVVSVQERGLLTGYLSEIGIEPIICPDPKLPALRPVWKQLGTFAAVEKLFGPFLVKHGIEAVHSHDLRMHVAWSHVCRKRRVPHVWHQRTPSPSKTTHRFSRHSRAVVTVSNFCRSQLPAAMAERAQVVYNPFDTALSIDRTAARSRVLEELGRGDDAVLVGFISNVTPRKRLETFLRMAAELVDTQPDVPWCFPVLGDMRGEHAQDMSALVDTLGISKHVPLMGPKYPAVDWMAALDVFVAPAVQEALGRTMIEAMLLGVPVVASADGGNLEIFEDCVSGRLVPPDNPRAFARAVQWVRDDPARARAMVEKAREVAATDFSKDRHVAGVLDVYREVGLA